MDIGDRDHELFREGLGGPLTSTVQALQYAKDRSHTGGLANMSPATRFSWQRTNIRRGRRLNAELGNLFIERLHGLPQVSRCIVEFFKRRGRLLGSF